MNKLNQQHLCYFVAQNLELPQLSEEVEWISWWAV